MASGWRYPAALGETSFTGGPTTNGWQPQNFPYGNGITADADGTITQIQVRVDSNSGTPAGKIAIFNSSGGLLGSGTFTYPASVGWVGASGLSVSVSSGQTYYVLAVSQTEWARYYYNTGDAGAYGVTAYASFPPSTETIGSDAGFGYGARMWLEEGAAPVTGTISVTNANSTSSASGKVTVKGTISKTSVNDTATSTQGKVTSKGTIARTNASDTSASQGKVTSKGTVNVTVAGDTCDASGTIGQPITGTVDVTGASDTLNASGDVSTPQYARPTSNVSISGWTDQDSNPASYVNIDEVSPNDADFNRVHETGVPAVWGLSVTSDPHIDTRYVMRYRLRGDGATDAIIRLKEVDTVRAQWTETNVPAGFTDYEHLLSEAEGASIVNHANLRIEAEAA